MSLSTPHLLNQTNYEFGNVKASTDHLMLGTSPVEALQESYTRNLYALTRLHWPSFLHLYNKTTNGRYSYDYMFSLVRLNYCVTVYKGISMSFLQSLFKPLLIEIGILPLKHKCMMKAGLAVDHLPVFLIS